MVRMLCLCLKSTNRDRGPSINPQAVVANPDVEDEVVVSQREAKISKRKTSNPTLTDTGMLSLSDRTSPKRRTTKKFPFDIDSAADSTDANSSSRPNPSPRYGSLSASETSPTSSPPLAPRKGSQTGTRRGSSSEVNLYSTSGPKATALTPAGRRGAVKLKRLNLSWTFRSTASKSRMITVTLRHPSLNAIDRELPRSLTMTHANLRDLLLHKSYLPSRRHPSPL